MDDVEELIVGNLAADILTGGKILPLRQYFAHGWFWAGQSATAFMTIAAYYVLGSSYLSLKLSFLVLQLITFVLLFVVMDRYISRKAATLACLLYLFPSATFIYYQLWVNSFHQCIITFVVAILLIWRNAQISVHRTSQMLWVVLLGYLMGLSTLFWGSNFIVAGIVAMFCLWEWRRGGASRIIKNSALLLLGFIIGYIPVLSRFSQALAQLSAVGYDPGRTISQIVRRSLILAGPTLSAVYEPWVPCNMLLHQFAYAAGIIAYIWVLFRLVVDNEKGRSAMHLFVAIYPPIYVLIVALSALNDAYGFKESLNPCPFGLRYSNPLIAISVIAESIMICDFTGYRNIVAKTLGILILVVLMCFGLFSLYSILVPVEKGYGAKQPGYFAQEIGCCITEQYLDDWSRFTPLMERVLAKKETTLRNDIARGAAWLTCLYRITDDNFHISNPKKFQAYINIAQKHVPAGLQQLFKEEIGAFVFCHTNYNLKLSLDKLAQGLSEKDAELSYIGLARMLPAWTTDPSKLEEAIHTIPLKNKNHLAYAIGQYFSALPDQERTVRSIADKITERESFLAGSRDPFGTRMYWPPIHCH
ncbi:MAG: hypothetical protein NTX71_10355 [Candidatus Aureabacteria bacterium]|nr:hypothetical protein [Candidatus Auribacterota bacterium]